MDAVVYSTLVLWSITCILNTVILLKEVHRGLLVIAAGCSVLSALLFVAVGGMFLAILRPEPLWLWVTGLFFFVLMFVAFAIYEIEVFYDTKPTKV